MGHETACGMLTDFLSFSCFLSPPPLHFISFLFNDRDGGWGYTLQDEVGDLVEEAEL